jgi:hypothetical protein
MPSIDGVVLAPVTQAQLAGEVFTVRHRPPEVAIALPPIWSNSRRATEAYVAAMTIDTARATDLRRDIYRALWKDGRDINDPAVVTQLMQSHGFGELGEWQRQWEEGPFDRSRAIDEGPFITHAVGGDDVHFDTHLAGAGLGRRIADGVAFENAALAIDRARGDQHAFQ